MNKKYNTDTKQQHTKYTNKGKRTYHLGCCTLSPRSPWQMVVLYYGIKSSFACAEIVNKTINHTVHLAINTITQYIMTTKQQHKDYSCLILKDLRPSESISLYSICAGTDHGMNANWTPSLSLSCFK